MAANAVHSMVALYANQAFVWSMELVCLACQVHLWLYRMIFSIVLHLVVSDVFLSFVIARLVAPFAMQDSRSLRQLEIALLVNKAHFLCSTTREVHVMFVAHHVAMTVVITLLDVHNVKLGLG